ncbi:MAG: gliding motility-associated C-terminal domain-containing protein [Bacteroides sp.]|nr:gliding motility-associated C-terminal domain-containing protein [Bacteroides sp.]
MMIDILKKIIILKKIGIISMVPIFSVNILNAEEISFSGNDLPQISIIPEKSTGIDNIFILYDTKEISISFTSLSNNVRWMKFSNLGGGFAEEINNISVSGNVYTLISPETDMGYIIYDNDKSYTFWLINYSNYIFNIDSINLPTEQDCDVTFLEIEGKAIPIYYYTINGKQEILDREINILYNTLKWDADRLQFINEDIVKTIPYINEQISITPSPLCNTYFVISGDRFLKFWNMAKEVESDIFITNAVDCRTSAIQADNSSEDSSNIIDSGIDGLGGSAPCEILFNAYTSDAVIHNEWQIADDEEFDNITYRITEQDFTYIFTDEGVKYVRFVGSNSDGSCESYGDTYTISIGASQLLIPNAFSPNDDGVNDIWKVSYRSLVDFECWIFDRQGHQLFHFNNPSDGWDGKHNGTNVKAGVYFYVIKATGSDGKKYNKRGDINIITYKGGTASSTIDNN